jgi:hypothetical protein
VEQKTLQAQASAVSAAPDLPKPQTAQSADHLLQKRSKDTKNQPYALQAESKTNFTFFFF